MDQQGPEPPKDADQLLGRAGRRGHPAFSPSDDGAMNDGCNLGWDCWLAATNEGFCMPLRDPGERAGRLLRLFPSVLLLGLPQSPMRRRPRPSPPCGLRSTELCVPQSLRIAVCGTHREEECCGVYRHARRGRVHRRGQWEDRALLATMAQRPRQDGWHRTTSFSSVAIGAHYMRRVPIESSPRNGQVHLLLQILRQ